jgi:hypothetical protein
MALANPMHAIVKGDVPDNTADILSSATLIVLLKKDAGTTMATLNQHQGSDYLQPQRPVRMGMPFVKITSNYTLTIVRDAMGPTVGPSQFAAETKGGCDLLQWSI